MTQVLFKPTFVRSYKKLSVELREEVKEKIEMFKIDTSSPSLKVHKFKGKMKDFYSFSVNYRYRIVFSYKSKNLVTFLNIGDHDVYK